MGKNSSIGWTDHTFNPWIGCTKVSPGCENCYAEEFMTKHWRQVQWGPTATRKLTAASTWAGPVRWQREAKRDSVSPRRRVFCASLADVFERKAIDLLGADLDFWRSELWSYIASTPNLDWLLLTKRPENIIEMIPAAWRQVGGWPHNVWIGTSVENQHYADRRIDDLLAVHSPNNFLSIEPMLGPVRLAPWIDRLQWIIAGGESGPAARPMDESWATSIRDECIAASVPFFFKQWGGRRHDSNGNLLEGAQWMQFPEYRPIPIKLRTAVPT